MTDINDPLDVIVLLKVPVHHHNAENAWWNGGTDSIYVNRRDPDVLWSLAHEAGHATGAEHRLNRRSMQFYFRAMNRDFLTKLFGPNYTLTCIRVEEAICDLVALALTGKSRRERALRSGVYPPVTPGTRTERYVQYHAMKAIEYIIQQQEAA